MRDLTRTRFEQKQPCSYIPTGRPRQPDPDRGRGDGVREDHPDHPVPGGGGLHRPGQDRLHPAPSSGRHVRGQEGV